MFFLSLYRSVKFAAQSFWRNFWLSLITIFIIILTFLSLNFLVSLNFLSQAAIDGVKDKIDVSVYFKEGVKETAIIDLQNQLKSLAIVKEVNYKSAEQNLEEFKAAHQSSAEILSTLNSLDGNPLGGTLNIKAKNTNDYGAILNILDQPDLAEILQEKNFDTHESIIQKINTLSNNVTKAGAVISLIFAFIVCLIVFNTIRIAIFSHREEIIIMKLVGASNIFVRAPFIWESIFYAIIGCLIGALLLCGGLNLLQPQLSNFFIGMDVNLVQYYNANWLLIFGLEFVFIAILDIIASSLAVGKYLKV